jgi:D-alanyl-D-alanine carboxypeptidase (penicillin-binding protein 5/6)
MIKKNYKKYILINLIILILFGHQALAFDSKAKSALLIDYDSGQELFIKNKTDKIFPASMSKLMTLYVLFDSLERDIVSLKDEFPVSMNAYQKEGSTIYAELGTEISVEDLIRGIIVSSGNDACIIVAESLAGSEDNFVDQLNFYAKEMGLSNSNFMNSSGLHDDNHYSTVEDLTILAKRIIEDFPDYYHYFSDTSFTWNDIIQYNRNNILKSNIGVDGLKTGYTSKSGFGIIVSSEKDDKRLIAIVTGIESIDERTFEITRLLNYGYRGFKNYKIFSKNHIIDYADVWKGEKEQVPIVIPKEIDLYLNIPGRRGLKVEYSFRESLIAPINRDEIIGEIKIIIPNNDSILLPLHAGEDVKKVNFFSGFIKSLDYFLFRNE